MQAGRIILLNGSSSAGKTTLAITLQQLLPDPWHHIALDQFRDGLGGRYRWLNSPPGTPGAQGAQRGTGCAQQPTRHREQILGISASRSCAACAVRSPRLRAKATT